MLNRNSDFTGSDGIVKASTLFKYWVPQKLPQIYAAIAYICTGKV